MWDRAVVAYKAHNLMVGGSNPPPATKYMVVAQQVVFLVWVQEVAGSSPVYHTIFKYQIYIFINF